MEFSTWEEIDAELDLIEQGDMQAVVAVFEKHRAELLIENGRRVRVTVTSFARHIDMPRHTLDSWVAMAAMERESA
jgi:hypothetical protein